MIKRSLTQALLLLFVLSLSESWAVQKPNGFDVSDALVPAEEILAGGPPRDGIPAIDKPRFLQGDIAREIAADAQILGIELNGVAKAYPLGIMTWHEIVNDRFRNTPIVVTYCPLCGSGMAFFANVQGQSLEFGVSGLLYNSDVLLYDRATESLWSQLDRRAISGYYKGERLEPIVMEHTTWRDWLTRHPNTLLLSRETGILRNYDQSPYTGYEHSDEIHFPVSFRTRGYHPKERVLGIEIGDRFKAYPFSELSRIESEMVDQVSGQRILIRFEAKHQNAWVEDAQGTILPSVVVYWFAWYTFHPDTEVFRAADRD